MTYLTRMTLNPARRGTQKLLGSPQAMHAAVLSGFPDPIAPDQEGRVLWRTDPRSDAPGAVLWMVSPTRPDLTHLVEQAGWPSLGGGWESRSYQPLLDRLANGQEWAFRLTANPIRRSRPEGGTGRGIVTGHVTADQQLAWLLRQAAPAGFAVKTTPGGEPAVSVSERRTARFRREASRVSITQARFDGLLTVEDAQVLTRTLLRGFGRAKAYGCGLLTLAPPGQSHA